MGSQVVRPLELLVGMRAIARFLKISHHRIRELEKKGAPIARDKGGVTRAEKSELWAWWRKAQFF